MGEKCYDLSDTHLPYVIDVLDCLKNDDECKAIFGNAIEVKGRYFGAEEGTQCSPALWIIPLDSVLKTDSRDLHCGVKLVHEFMVCVVVSCGRDIRNSICCDSDDEGTFVMGPLAEASKILSKIRCKLQECNEKHLCKSGKDLRCYSEFKLKRIPEPDIMHEHVHLCLVYETTFNY